MDPNHHQRNHLNSRRDTPLTPNVSGNDQTADNLNRNPPDGGNPQATDRQPQYSGGFTMIPPNAAQRSKMKMMAQKEEEELQRLKETHRVTSVHVNPERLGGNVTQAEARQKQFTDFRCSKLQKKLRQEELDRKKRQEEEEKLQKMKAEQREKSERLEERHRQEEQRRREQLSQDHLRTMENFLQRFETRAPVPQASSSGTHMSSRSEREKQEKSVREVQLEHKRVNSAFLDRLEGRGRGSEKETKREGVQEAARPCLACEDLTQQLSTTAGQQLPSAHLNPDPHQSCHGWTEETDPEPDYDWALMKLMNSFPDCSNVFLEDILDQCNGDYEQAYKLLSLALS
ncbi:epithelial-stromal interaction protein 1 isoform X2 [Toxotes jaculatrix]|uniref:epithelial-stromal interaction protein 1 isoform X2 n=1 Tax=Toxotes jaculatrix TaxID=941984 RepID=UPI001B3AE89F|nr:epithelial-stromal interaction protein 1 isoform X2 [Toxotes jaculatrix]